MNIYVETNFVLELVFQQEQHVQCDEILNLCEQGLAQLIIPAYSLAEPHEKMTRQRANRRQLQQNLIDELNQLTRNPFYAVRVNQIQDIASLLIQSSEEEQQRFTMYRNRLLQISTVIPLTNAVLTEAASFEIPLAVSPQDGLVLASVLAHLREDTPQASCFLNRNYKDFSNPDIIDELGRYNCRVIGRFDQGLGYIRAQLQR